MWYAVIDDATGALLSETSAAENVANPLPAGAAVLEFEAKMDTQTHVWDAEARQPAAKPEPPHVHSAAGLIGETPEYLALDQAERDAMHTAIAGVVGHCSCCPETRG